MDHSGGWRGTMPMLLARRNEDDIARLDLADRAALGLHPANACDHVERLTERMAMPRRPRARLEADTAGDDAHRRLRRDDRILPDGAGKAFARCPTSRARAREMDVHDSSVSLFGSVGWVSNPPLLSPRNGGLRFASPPYSSGRRYFFDAA